MISIYSFMDQVREKIYRYPKVTIWDHGVALYAYDLLSELQVALKDNEIDLDSLRSPAVLEKALLCGARDWDQYSFGGCSLCYDNDIAKRLFSVKQNEYLQKRFKIDSHTYLDAQAKALRQAAMMIRDAIQYVFKNMEEK